MTKLPTAIWVKCSIKSSLYGVKVDNLVSLLVKWIIYWKDRHKAQTLKTRGEKQKKKQTLEKHEEMQCLW